MSVGQIGRVDTLDDYRLLGNSGLRISPFCLGTMTFGTDWGWGSDKAESRKMFELYLDRGGNFIDTASHYTHGTSETFLGEFISQRRSQLVLGTQYTISAASHDPNASGNHRKHMVQSLEESLKRLKTDYIDIFWLHCWEHTTPIEEVMRALDDLVRAGKILYTGIANTPAWKIAQGNTIAGLRGWTPFIGIQTEYNLTNRRAERDLMPMANDLGLGVLAASPLAGGVLSGKYNSRRGRAHPEVPLSLDQTSMRAPLNRTIGLVNARNLAIAAEVIRIAQEVGWTPAQVALSWIVQQAETASTMLGARSCQQLEENLKCLEVDLTVTHMFQLDAISRIPQDTLHSYNSYISCHGIQRTVGDGARILNLRDRRE